MIALYQENRCCLGVEVQSALASTLPSKRALYEASADGDSLWICSQRISDTDGRGG